MAKTTEQDFRATFLLATGERLDFPIRPEAALEGIERATMWTDPPFNRSIVKAASDDRDVLFGAIVRLYTHIARKGEGVFYMGDDAGKEWGLLARSVVALFIDDPGAARNSGRKGRLGFTFDDEGESHRWRAPESDPG